MRISALLMSLACMAAVACGSSESKEAAPAGPEPPTNEEIMTIYSHYATGNYEAYVDAMASCDGKPADYRRQMLQLMKQHARLQQEANGGVASFHVNRVEPKNGGEMVNVYMEVTYNNKQVEEILIPMVYVNERWRLR